MTLTKEEFRQTLSDMLAMYADNYARYDHNPQVRVDPLTHFVSIVDGDDMLNEIDASDEVVEEAAAAENAASEDAGDYQASRVPEFYSMRKFVNDRNGRLSVDTKAVEKLAEHYFG